MVIKVFLEFWNTCLQVLKFESLAELQLKKLLNLEFIRKRLDQITHYEHKHTRTHININTFTQLHTTAKNRKN